PDSLVHARPGLCLCYAWALTLTGRLDDAEVWLARIKPGTSQAGPMDDLEERLDGRAMAVRACIVRLRGEMERSIELSRRALAILPADALAIRGITALNLGLACWMSGDTEAAGEA